MKSIKAFIAVITLATSLGFSTTQTVAVTGFTLENVKAKIAVRVERVGASDYKVTQAYTGNRVHMTIELLK